MTTQQKDDDTKKDDLSPGQAKSRSQKTIEESEGASIDLSAGTSKPYLDEEGGYTQVNRAGPDEQRLDNVKAHGDIKPLDPGEGLLDRDVILAGDEEDTKKRVKDVKDRELKLSEQLERQRIPRHALAAGDGTVVQCPNCGAYLGTEGGRAVAV